MKKPSPKLILIITVAAITVVFTAVMLAVTFIKPVTRFAAVDDAATTAEDVAATITVLQNDTDADVSTLEIQSYTQPSHGYVIKYGTGLRYTPYTNYNGTDSFTYTIENAAGETATATVTVTITEVNDEPKAYDDVASTTEGAGVVIDVAVNDNDSDGDALTVDSYTHPDHGTVSITDDNKILYVPDTGYVGTDEFTYDVIDPDGANDRATVVVTVRADD